MSLLHNPDLIDLGVILCVNLYNLLLVVMFWARVAENPGLARAAGIGTLVLALPLALLALSNWRLNRDWWRVVLPLLLVAFLGVELVLDYLLKIDFRQGRLLGPYLLLYYLASMVMVGYAFLVSVPAGAVTLVTYFLQVGIGIYARIKTGL